MKKILLLLSIVVLSTAGGFVWWTTHPLLENEAELNFIIQPNSSARSLARQMQVAGVPVNRFLFEVLVRLSGRAAQLKAGPYEVEAGDTPWRLLEKMVNGEYSHTSLVVIEGWTFAQMKKAIDAHPFLRHDTLDWSEAMLMQKLGSESPHAEGLFFPDTYLFAKGGSDFALYQQAYDGLQKRLLQAWGQRRDGLPYRNVYEALVMASLVEKETGRESDRSKVASVFVNRLNRGMLLQTDPSVIYGMGEQYSGKIHKRDLQADTPYNTYTRTGLPPTPIALPGAASIQAALAPAPGQALYFVARGDGSSEFSETLEAHNRAVNKYIRK